MYESEMPEDSSIKSIDQLIKDLKDYLLERRINAAIHLRLRSKTAQKAIPTLIEALQDENLGVRTKAAEALIDIDEQIALEELVKVLQSKDINLRYSAIFSLGQMKEKAEPALHNLTTALTMETELELQEYLEDIINELVKS
ncbi:MAG: HEAT repeat domain-containing protein [Candidatus Thorarchaeota archaeon]